MYSRDLSQKVKSTVTTRMKRGEYIGPFGLFGYEKSPEDIHKLVIDDEAAAIVRYISSGKAARETGILTEKRAAGTQAWS